MNGWARGAGGSTAIANVLGIDEKDQSEILRRLQELPVEEILEVQEKLKHVSLFWLLLNAFSNLKLFSRR